MKMLSAHEIKCIKRAVRFWGLPTDLLAERRPGNVITLKYLLNDHQDQEWTLEVLGHRAKTRCKWRGRTLPLPG